MTRDDSDTSISASSCLAAPDEHALRPSSTARSTRWSRRTAWGMKIAITPAKGLVMFSVSLAVLVYAWFALRREQARQQRPELLRGDRLREEEALHHVAPVAAKEHGLFFHLDAFRDDFEAEGVGHGDDGGDDGGAVRVGVDVADEGLVDLERVDREALEVGERRVAGAEVVERDADAELLQLREDPQRDLGRLHRRRLGDLQLQLIGREAA